MKIALNIVGITHNDGKHERWDKSNLIDVIVKPLSTENQVSVYLTTYYENDKTTKLLKDVFSTKNISFSKKHDRQLTYINSLEKFIDSDYDVVISTRPDIYFHKKLDEFGILEYDRFNFLFKESGWWDSQRFTTDNFYIIPKRYLQDFIESIKELQKNPPRPGFTDLHGLYDKIEPKIKKENINIISEVEQLSHQNQIFSLCRFL